MSSLFSRTLDLLEDMVLDSDSGRSFRSRSRRHSSRRYSRRYSSPAPSHRWEDAGIRPRKTVRFGEATDILDEPLMRQHRRKRPRGLYSIPEELEMPRRSILKRPTPQNEALDRDIYHANLWRMVNHAEERLHANHSYVNYHAGNGWLSDLMQAEEEHLFRVANWDAVRSESLEEMRYKHRRHRSFD